MVMACCNLCYRKYLNADGSLNKEGLDEIYGEDKYKILVDEPQNKALYVHLPYRRYDGHALEIREKS